jgi:hypothetical protein
MQTKSRRSASGLGKERKKTVGSNSIAFLDGYNHGMNTLI